MSFLNPFHELFETKEYPHARTLRTTFGQKVSDTFFVYFGGINLLADIDNKDTSKKPSLLHFGIFDYLTLGIPYVLTAIPMLISVGSSSLAIRLISLLISAILLLPRAIFAGVMTLASLPFIGIAQGISSLFASKYKHRIKTFEVDIQENGSSTKATLGALLKREHIQLEDLSQSTVTKDAANERFFNVELSISNSDKTLPPLQLVRGSRKHDQLFKSLCHLNIGRLQSGIELEQQNKSNLL